MYKVIACYDSLKHFQTPLEEYIKRMGKQLEIIPIKPSKKDTIEEVKRDETKLLIEKIDKYNGYIILLDIWWKLHSTIEFSQWIEKMKQVESEIIFVIGWVYGYTEELYDSIDAKISLSSLTFPHNLALLVLLEQLYRIESIQSGKQYHY